MDQIGVLPIRPTVDPFDALYSVALPSGDSVVASRLVALSTGDDTLLGPALGALDASVLNAVEDRLCAFLQIPELLRPSPRLVPPLGDASAYAVWGGLYRAGPVIEGEIKRRVVVSPNPWNAVSGMATFVRTTSSFRRHGAEFPELQRGQARACCGDATTFSLSSVRLDRRDRPSPSVATMTDIVAIARGLIITHELAGAVERASVGS